MSVVNFPHRRHCDGNALVSVFGRIMVVDSPDDRMRIWARKEKDGRLTITDFHWFPNGFPE